MALASREIRHSIDIQRLDQFVQGNGSIILMLSAQVCAIILSTTGRVLRTGASTIDRNAVGTSEIVFFMMAISAVLTWVYAWLAKIPEAPLGRKSTRPLLIIRGVLGTFGIWGFYFSLRYLDVAEATMINFIAPMLAILLVNTVTGRQTSPGYLLAGFVSIIGAVLALKPWSVHPTNTLSEQVVAIVMALVGVLGGAGAYVIISVLGEDSHPVTTVSYFNTICTVMNGVAMIVQGRKGFILPSISLQWSLIFAMGLTSFAMQCLSTASLTWDRDPGRALNVVYTQIVFSMMADKLVWHISPDVWKYGGAILVLSSAVFVAIKKPHQQYTLVENELEDVEQSQLSREPVQTYGHDQTGTIAET
ncbi:MAG: hypothetical protein Q9165_002344 [Trypethelium subeluteriae]